MAKTASRKSSTGSGARRSPIDMSAADMTAWRERHAMTKQQAADALGLTLRAIYQFEGAERSISPTVALLCDAYDRGFGRR